MNVCRSLVLALVISLTAAFTAKPQPVETPSRLGLVFPGSSANPMDRAFVEAFRQGLRDVDFPENRDVIIDVVWITTDAENARAVGELAQRGAKVLVTAGASASMAARHPAMWTSQEIASD